MDKSKLIERIYDHVEGGDVDKATFACLRLARSVGDTFNVLMFLREMSTDRKQLLDLFYHEVEHLKDDTRNALWESTGKRWISERSFASDEYNDEGGKVLNMGVGELKREIEKLENAIADIQLPTGMGAYDTAAFADRYNSDKVHLRIKISNCNTVLERIRSRCFEYATRIERTLKSGDDAAAFLGEVQVEVNNYFAEHCPNVYRKLAKASSLIKSSEPEDHSLLLASIRRAVNGVADHFFEPKSAHYKCSDGVERDLGSEQYLNRLEEFCRSLEGSGVSRELFLAELGFFVAFFRRLNRSASKGVHSNVSFTEAKQGLIGLYMFLWNLVARVERKVI